MPGHARREWLERERFAVFGLGRSGRAVSRLLAARGKRVLASDTREREEFGGELDELPDEVDLVFGDNEIGDAEVAVVSPGLKPHLEIFEALRERSVPAVSEIEIAWEASRAPILALTGTDGKTTTTAMLGEIARCSERPSATGGNIGTPLSAVVDEVPAEGVVVAEVSAFQLWTCHGFRPRVAGFTNIAGDHLDYFDDRRSYRQAKRRLQANLGGDDCVVYNLDDPLIEQWSRTPPARRAVYSLRARPSEQAAIRTWLRDGWIVAERDGETRRLVDREAIGVPGEHNVSNAMCAATMALAAGLSAEAIGRGVARFEALPHRVEPCGEVDGVRFVNDSKATNVNAALAGLSSLEEGFVAIVGGLDKGLDLAPLCEHLRERASGVVVIGEITDRLVAQLRAEGDGGLKIKTAESLEEATRLAFDRAVEQGSEVVLSPACSSFDMFDSYKERGEVFRRAVERHSSSRATT